MKTIFKIAKAELYSLFFSPIAWLIMVIFAFQADMSIVSSFENYVTQQSLGYTYDNLTSGIFAGWHALFPNVQDYLYLYIPLLTMGLMSRELSSGSIKLIYSSPVTNTQIILGKYLSMMIYGLFLVLILVLPIIFGVFTIKDMDIPFALSGLLGIYLLICAYSAIGLFMSCLTSYQVVAAVGTLAVLAILNFIGGVGQDIALIRDVTYWFSISGRCEEMVNGLISSADVMYFFIVIVLFLMISIMKLRNERERRSNTAIAGQYCLIIAAAVLLGYFTSRPAYTGYIDATRTKARTLTQNSQDIMKLMDGKLKVTSYINMLEENNWVALPANINADRDRFEQYLRFKPDMELEYIYYYKTTPNPFLEQQYPNLSEKERAEAITKIHKMDFDMLMSPEEVAKIIDLSPENYRFVRVLERENGQKTFLRIYDDMQRLPTEAEISAAMKRLIVKQPKVLFALGHGEREIEKTGDREYNMFANNKTYRFSLENQGFNTGSLVLSDNTSIPEDVDVLVIAEPKEAFSEQQMAELNRYIARGGNLIIAGEPGRQNVLNPFLQQFGVQMTPGVLVQTSENFSPDLVVGNVSAEVAPLTYIFDQMSRYNVKVTMPGCAGLTYEKTGDFNIRPLVVSDAKGCWNELETTNFIDEKPTLDPATGESEAQFTTALALNRNINGKEQKIIILGDADCISNSELSRGRENIRSSNYTLINGMFYWLSDNEFPIDSTRPDTPDTSIKLPLNAMIWMKILFLGLIPGLLAIAGILIWFRRRGR